MKKKGIYTIAQEETFQNGQIIFEQKSPGGVLYIVLSGSAEISRTVRGHKFVIEKLQPGDVFGEMEFFGGMRRAVAARAIGDTTLGVIDLEPMKIEYQQLSNQFRSILETIPTRLKKMLDRACDLSG